MLIWYLPLAERPFIYFMGGKVIVSLHSPFVSGLKFGDFKVNVIAGDK